MTQSRYTLLLCTLLVLFCIGLVAQSPGKSDSASDVTILLSALNKSGISPINLLREDLRILEDGESRQIISVEEQSAVPISMSFLIDMSPSQAGSVPAERAAALALINSTLRSGKDMAAVYTFAGELSLRQPLTNDLIAVRSAIQRLDYHPSSQNGSSVKGAPSPSSKVKVAPIRTAIWDAIFAICNQPTQPSFGKVRRVVVVMSDGMDNGSQKKLSDAIGSALKSNSAIYAFRLVLDRADYGYGHETLKEISRQTGGREFSPKNVRDLTSAVAQIQKELQSQFSITYSSPSKNPSDPYRKIEIKVVNAEKKNRLELLYPPRYYVVRL